MGVKLAQRRVLLAGSVWAGFSSPGSPFSMRRPSDFCDRSMSDPPCDFGPTSSETFTAGIFLSIHRFDSSVYDGQELTVTVGGA